MKIREYTVSPDIITEIIAERYFFVQLTITMKTASTQNTAEAVSSRELKLSSSAPAAPILKG